jgi:dihydrolipoamide dehydrogenase
MSVTVSMPKLGLTMTEGTVQEWKKNEGDSVAKGDILLVVATEKLTYEIEAPEEGVVLKILVQTGQTVPVGSPLGIVGAAGESVETPGSATVDAKDQEETAEDVPPRKPQQEAVPSSVPEPVVHSATSELPGKKKVVVIGGGPGGYVAAIRAAQLGGDVTLVEKARLGGTCINVGCIPTKALLHASEVLETIRNGAAIGIDAGSPVVDWSRVHEHKNAIISQLVKGIHGLLGSNGVSLLQGEGSFLDEKTLAVRTGKGTEKIQGDVFIIASGSEPVSPPIPGIDLEGVIDSTGALELQDIPSSMVIVGGGVIGIEFASLYKSFGCDVTIIEMLPDILPGADREVASTMRRIFERKGITIHTGSRVSSLAVKGGSLTVTANLEGEEKTLKAEKVLVAVGRRPLTGKLNLEAAGVRSEKGRIQVDEHQRTNKRNIYAVGDCCSPIMLAHVAMREGIVAAENIFGQAVKMDHLTTPGCVYTSPEVAWAGMTEEQARSEGKGVRTGIFPLVANAKSLTLGETSGMIKIIADEKYGEILGVHIIGPRATDLITEGALALRLEATLEEIADTIHAHPTVGEAMAEAANVALGMGIHISSAKGKKK